MNFGESLAGAQATVAELVHCDRRFSWLVHFKITRECALLIRENAHERERRAREEKEREREEMEQQSVDVDVGTCSSQCTL